jgi:hydrogenase-4 component E
MTNLAFDVCHLLASGMVVVSFVILYQNRLASMLNFFAIQAAVLAGAVAWQANIQNAPQLYVTAAIALIVKAGLIPVVLQRIMKRLGIHREVEQVVGVGLTLLAGVALSALAILVVFPVTTHAASFTREDLAFALAIILLGLLMMISRRNAVSQIIGFMSLENGLILAGREPKACHWWSRSAWRFLF